MDNNSQQASNLSLFTTLLTAAVTLYNYPNIDPNLRVTNVPNSEIQAEYDFIIVGAGSAGNVLANRLTEISNWTVLLLEAGGDETVESDTPILNYNLWFSDMDWNYTTVPQQNACLATNGSCTWPRGRVIGGSSVVNDFVYVRGNPQDFNNWSERGNSGWSFNEIFPYYLRSEDNEDPAIFGSPFHAQGGYLTINRSPFLTPLASAFIQSGEELGYNNVDVNGPNQTGFMISQGLLRNGSRCSTGKAFLRPARNRRNLNVAMRTLVTKININNETKTATGVTFIKNSVSLTVNARKEVIVSAGTINSPQLLMLSGIGPQEHLQEIGIPIIQNLSVGNNLHDHVGFPVLFTTAENVTINWKASFQNMSAIVDYAENHRGPLTTLLGVECVAFINITNPPNPNGIPDSEILFTTYIPFNQNGQLFAVIPFFLHPQSRGTVRLRDSNPSTPPLIDPRYFSTPTDINAAMQNLRTIFQIVQTNALQQFGTEFFSSAYGLCSDYTNLSNEFFLCFLRQYSVTIYHPVGTCKMGPRTDPNAVVDTRLRVYGMNNLRVIDASVIPEITTGNTNGPTIMIAERASDLIKEDYGQLTL